MGISTTHVYDDRQDVRIRLDAFKAAPELERRVALAQLSATIDAGPSRDGRLSLFIALTAILVATTGLESRFQIVLWFVAGAVIIAGIIYTLVQQSKTQSHDNAAFWLDIYTRIL